MSAPFPKSLTLSIDDACYLVSTNDFDNTAKIINYVPKENNDMLINSGDQLFEDVLKLG